MDDKIKVLIASVLKPADDVRSCYKIGQSLAQTNKYEVNIIGFDSKKKVESKNIFLHPIFKFRRNSLKRLTASSAVLKIYLQLKPQIIIVNTPELLWVIFLIKILFGTKIIYDIRENYRFNVHQNPIYKGIIKHGAILYIKFTELISKKLMDGYFLAEDIYEKQLKFIHNQAYIKLLNKSVIPLKQSYEPVDFSNHEAVRYIYSGTIGEEYGTLEAIEFCKKLHEINQNTTLMIIGYSSDNQYINKVKSAISGINFIHLKTGSKPVAQSEIISEIKNYDVALLPYQLNPNISGRFPTKIYDYLALGIPMVIPPQKEWIAFLNQYQAGISADFYNPDIPAFIHEIKSRKFFLHNPKSDVQWWSQENTLLDFIDKILSK
ncbi:hypothetical protein [Marivirga sp.]|uniref:hypothetical protein n=1 Tax=Marivirga sp. TaxID=2018662 RepID=UPI002D7FD9E2|nr:hypothetical protein [Marivirga sp.]HET8859059.1 hypothetical protein [Marivirga sp.]